MKNAGRSRARVAASLPLFLLGNLLGGCVPTSFNDFPLYMSVEGDVLLFLWCGSSLDNLDQMEISYALFTADIEDHLAAKGRGHFSISEGTQFSNLQPPRGLQYQEQAEISIEQRRTMVFVDMRSREPSVYGPSVVFDVQDPTQIMEGSWIRPDGAVASETCSARAVSHVEDMGASR